jgi:Flp pilus assembly protein TadD
LSVLICVTLAACATAPEPIEDTSGTRDAASQVQSSMLQGDQAYRAGDSESALFHYVTALNLDADNTDLLYRVGMIHSENNRLDAADQAFRQILELNPDHAGALEGHGLVLLRQRKYDSARQVLEQAVGLERGRWRAQNGLGVISDIENDHALAITYYQLALEQRPGTPMVLNNLGYSYYLAGDWDAAEDAFTRAVKSDPKHQKTWSNLGMLYTRKGDYEQALQAFSRFLTKPEAYNSMGYVCMVEGKFDRAEAFFLDAIRLSPSYYEAAHENLARARARHSARSDSKTLDTYGLEVDSPAPSKSLP